jgi:hypothetical protein
VVGIVVVELVVELSSSPPRRMKKSATTTISAATPIRALDLGDCIGADLSSRPLNAASTVVLFGLRGAGVKLAPVPGSNGVGDLRHELDYLHAHISFTGVGLVNGTEPFNPRLVGAVLGG